MLHGGLNGFFHKSMAKSSGIDTEIDLWITEVRSGQRGVWVDLMLMPFAIRSCGQAVLWSCYVVLVHGIVWASTLFADVLL